MQQYLSPAGTPEELSAALERADAIVVGAGAGLSAAAGFTYSGPRFQTHFSDFQQRYGFSDMYTGGFYPFPGREEFWAYWSRYILLNRYQDPPGPVYRDLLRLLDGRDYFVLTTNVDHCFQRAGFPKERLFYTQGDYGLFQCSHPCRQETFDNEETVRSMVARQKDLKVPGDLLPRCPHCGRPMTVNLRSDDRFVEDAGWHRAARRYREYLLGHSGARLLFLELGVGFNTPAIIKYPFWRMTGREPNAVYACINDSRALCPQEIAPRSLCIRGDIGPVLRRLLS